MPDVCHGHTGVDCSRRDKRVDDEKIASTAQYEAVVARTDLND